MNKIKVIKLLIISIFTFVTICLVVFLGLPGKGSDVFVEVVELKSSHGKPSIFLKKKVWGMTSDNQIAVISGSGRKDFVPDLSNDYIYNGLSPIFYKLRNDSLEIYVYKCSAVPKLLQTGFKIIQIELENPDMMNLITNDNYKNKGMMVF